VSEPIIRQAEPRDAAAIAAIYGPFCTDSYWTFEEAAPTAAAMTERLLSPTHPWLVCEIDGQTVGYAYAARFHERASYRWAVSVSLYLDERARGQGVGPALYRSLLELLKLQRYQTAYALISVGNDHSFHMHEKAGFARVGTLVKAGYKLGGWRDVSYWHLDLAPEALLEGPEPPTPLTIAEAQKLPGWPTAIAAGQPLIRSR
jgi:phosphinothricin acetyltransferase